MEASLDLLRKRLMMMNIVVVVVVLGLWNGGGVGAAPQVPCYFIFGDSLVDNGNNNQLQSLARADYLPYGIDFPNGPSGRFSNGKTTVDAIGLWFYIYFIPWLHHRRFSAVQLWKHVSHRHSFFYLEQQILKHGAAASGIRIKQMDQDAQVACACVRL